MKKINLKNNKGITLVSLAFSIVIIIMLTSMIVYHVPDYVHTKNLKDMQNDIQIVKEKVMNYYAKNSSIPGSVQYSWSVNPTKTYYIIDLQQFDGLTLNYGKTGYNAYKNIRANALNGSLTDEQIQELNEITDIFIVDSETLDVYYVQGITFDGVTYYTYKAE